MGPVEKINPDATIPASNLPPCGILHQPKELLYVHEDPRTVTTAIVVTSVVAAVLLAGLVALAVYISPPIFGGIAAVGLVFYSIQLVGQLREIRFGGLFADDLHVGKVATDWLGRFERKVFDRTAVLEVTVETGKISVVGVDGSTLFWTSLLSASEMNRYADFLGVRVVRDVAPAGPDPNRRAPVARSPDSRDHAGDRWPVRWTGSAESGQDSGYPSRPPRGVAASARSLVRLRRNPVCLGAHAGAWPAAFSRAGRVRRRRGHGGLSGFVVCGDRKPDGGRGNGRPDGAGLPSLVVLASQAW